MLYIYGKHKELMSVIFISTDSSILHSIICKNTDQFTKIETQLYKEFPDYGDLENLFFINGNKINNIKYEDINNFPNKEAKKILEKYANNNLLNKTTNNKIDEELDKLRKENIFLKKELKELKEDSSMNKSKIDN